MLILYMRPWCPFCMLVFRTAEKLGVTFTEKNIGERANADELVARGGKQQVPYLVDTERGVEMYESRDIIAYLEKHYGHTATS